MIVITMNNFDIDFLSKFLLQALVCMQFTYTYTLEDQEMSNNDMTMIIVSKEKLI